MKLLRTTCGFAFLAKPLGASGVARDVRNCPLRYQPWAFGRLSFSRCWLHFLTGNSGERSFLARRFEVATHPVGASRPQRKQPRPVKLLACSAASETQTSLRTHVCGALRSEHVGCTVTVCGWAHTIRDRGGVTFLLLRDRHGIVQVTIDAASPEALRTQVKTIRRESVVRVRGTVRARDPANVNASMPTGSVEIAAHVIEVLNRADPLPLVLDMERPETGNTTTGRPGSGQLATTGASEETRLRYRYLDLRRASLQSALIRRHEATMAVRRVLDSLGFVEIETPILTRATPEGARDYLVPSRVHRGKWYALPQSPQLYKQLLMIGGMDRYFQVARCFRDEDLRQDRQPEFTQVDLEMSFVGAADVMHTVERVAAALFSNVLSEQELKNDEVLVRNTARQGLRFPVMTYDDCMERYGTDAPDLRFGLELQPIWSANQGEFNTAQHWHFFEALCAVAPFRGAETIRALVVPGAAPHTSRKVIDDYTQFVKQLGLSGLLWGKIGSSDGRPTINSGPLNKLEPTVAGQLVEQLGARPDSLLLVAAGSRPVVLGSLGRLRVKIAKERGFVDETDYRFCWVVGFPLFAWDDEYNRLTSVHHPFTSPREDQRDLLLTLVQRIREKPDSLSKDATLTQELLKLRAEAYDLVCNGTEIGGGSIRIYDPAIQSAVLSVLAISDEEQQAKFGFLLQALRYGAPPHGGFAFGLDRCILMTCAQAKSLRDVIAFPKTTSASELMTAAPSDVDERQLADLGISRVAAHEERIDQIDAPKVPQDSQETMPV